MGETVKASVEAINRLRELAFDTGDVWEFIEHFTDDMVWMPMGEAAVVGKDAVRAWATRFDGQEYRFRVIPEEVVVSGDWAFERFVGIMTPISATGKAEGEPAYFQYFWTLRRQEDDSWKIVHWIWNKHPPV